ncbi:MFS transporter [Bacillus sp. A301a_S52]|nr:MFS transporter [Bacillus sp. A301a_S52]
MEVKLITVPKIKKDRSVWLEKNFLLLFFGIFLSNLTFHFFTLAIPIMIYNMTQSTLAMSSMRAMEFLPNLLLGMFIGVLFDRYNKKRIMIITILLQIISMTILIVLTITEMLNLWQVYLLGFCLYTCGFSFVIAYQSLLPMLIKRNQLLPANSMIQLNNTLTNTIGPALSGFLLLVVSYSYGFMVTVIGLTLLLIFVLLINGPYENVTRDIEKKNSTIWIEIKEGWYQLTSTDALWKGTLMILFMNLASATSGAVLIFYALDSLMINETHLGAILSAAAIGGLFSTFFGKRSRNWMSRGGLFLTSISIVILGQFMFLISQSWIYLCIGNFFIGLGVTFVNIHFITLRQELTPSKYLGRVIGTSSMITKLTMPISFLSVGFIAEFIEVRYVFVASLTILVLLFIFIRKPMLQIK